MLDQAHDTDVLEPEPIRQGGLVRKDLVSLETRGCSFRSLQFTDGRRAQQHTFRQPAKPLEPPTPRTSNLGLDRLAIEKRAAAAALQEDGNRKRQRADDGEPHFKGTQNAHNLFVPSHANNQTNEQFRLFLRLV
jgi:pre-mRNA-splicing factor ATP-dependent RNA helicase DHX38/PRP16